MMIQAIPPYLPDMRRFVFTVSNVYRSFSSVETIVKISSPGILAVSSKFPDGIRLRMSGSYQQSSGHYVWTAREENEYNTFIPDLGIKIEDALKQDTYHTMY